MCETFEIDTRAKNRNYDLRDLSTWVRKILRFMCVQIQGFKYRLLVRVLQKMFTDLHRPKNTKLVSDLYQMEVRAQDDTFLKYMSMA